MFLILFPFLNIIGCHGQEIVEHNNIWRLQMVYNVHWNHTKVRKFKIFNNHKSNKIFKIKLWKSEKKTIKLSFLNFFLQNYFAVKREKTTEQFHAGKMHLGVNVPIGMEGAEMSFFYMMGGPNMEIKFRTEDGVPYCLIEVFDGFLIKHWIFLLLFR